MRTQYLHHIFNVGYIPALFLSCLLIVATISSCDGLGRSSTIDVQPTETPSSDTVDVSSAASNSVVIEVEEKIVVGDETGSALIPTPTLTPVVIIVEENIIVSD